MPVLSEDEQRIVFGCGDGTAGNPYTQAECDAMMDNGTWKGGYVIGHRGYVIPEVTVYPSSSGNVSSDNNNSFPSGGSSSGGSGNLPLVPISPDESNFIGSVLSFTQEVYKDSKGVSRYVTIISVALTGTQVYNVGAGAYNKGELSSTDVYNLAIAAAGVNPITGAIATIVDSYKKGFDYMVKLKVELDRRLDYFFSSGAGYFY